MRAAAAPYKGINALRAVLLTFTCVDHLREHLRQDVRIHGIIAKGGGPVNIVPEELRIPLILVDSKRIDRAPSQ